MGRYIKDILMLGYAGDRGIRKILISKNQELLKYFNSSYIEKIYREALADEDFLHSDQSFSLLEGKSPLSESPGGEIEAAEAGEEGVLGALYRIAEEKLLGIRIELKAISIRQSTVEICEYYRLNPYYLPSSARILLSEKGGLLCEELKALGIHAVRIGSLTQGRDKIITDKEEVEYINRPLRGEMDKVGK